MTRAGLRMILILAILPSGLVSGEEFTPSSSPEIVDDAVDWDAVYYVVLPPRYRASLPHTDIQWVDFGQNDTHFTTTFQFLSRAVPPMQGVGFGAGGFVGDTYYSFGAVSFSGFIEGRFTARNSTSFHIAEAEATPSDDVGRVTVSVPLAWIDASSGDRLTDTGAGSLHLVGTPQQWTSSGFGDLAPNPKDENGLPPRDPYHKRYGSDYVFP